MFKASCLNYLVECPCEYDAIFKRKNKGGWSRSSGHVCLSSKSHIEQKNENTYTCIKNEKLR